MTQHDTKTPHQNDPHLAMRPPMRICLFGPESTGKSTLTRRLAAHYNAPFIPEYAEEYIKQKNGELHQSDLDIIIKEQLLREDRAAQTEPALLFCDSDALTTQIWSHHLYNSASDYIQREAAASATRYTHTILLDIDVPWVDDTHRLAKDHRQAFFDTCRTSLDALNRPYTIIGGDWQTRFEKSCITVNKIIK